MRKLASVRRITEIKEHPNADRLELAILDGWQVVVKKGQFKIGDLAVYFEIDSFLPEESIFEFLRKSCYRTNYNGLKGFRLRTTRLRGEISQGLLMPLSEIIDFIHEQNSNIRVRPHEGLDLTELLGVDKFERPIPAQLSGKVKGSLPSFFPKTDEERIQNLSTDELFDFLSGSETIWITEKLDGTSFTAYLNNGEFGVCSRNFELEYDENNTYWQIAKKYNFEEKMRELGENIAIQGEIIGPGIQKNRYRLKEVELRVFNIYDIDNGRYYTMSKVNKVNVGYLDIATVPIIEIFPGEGVQIIVNKNHAEWLEYAEGDSRLYEVEREGIVVKNEKGQSFKVISNKFLENAGE